MEMVNLRNEYINTLKEIVKLESKIAKHKGSEEDALKIVELKQKAYVLENRLIGY